MPKPPLSPDLYHAVQALQIGEAVYAEKGHHERARWAAKKALIRVTIELTTKGRYRVERVG